MMRILSAGSSLILACGCVGDRTASSQGAESVPQAPIGELTPAPALPQPDEEAPRFSLASLVQELAAAWYDANESQLTLLCDSRAAWLHVNDQEQFSCAFEPDTHNVHVIDTHGTGQWSIQERTVGGHRHNPELVRPGAQYPAGSMPVLVMREAPPAADARLILLPVSPPSKPAKSAARTVAKAVADLDDGVHVDSLRSRPVAEIKGAFGGGADTMVVTVTVARRRYGGLNPPMASDST